MLKVNESLFWLDSEHLAPRAVLAVYEIACNIFKQKLLPF